MQIQQYDFNSDPPLLAPYQGQALLEGQPTHAIPGTRMPVITNEGEASISLMRWGIRPEWAVRKGSPFERIFISRQEILDEVKKNRFREHRIQYSRCLIPATTVYLPGEAETQTLTAQAGTFFRLAGTYERWTSPTGEDMSSFAPITVRGVPAAIDVGAEERWLDLNFNDWNVLGAFLQPPKG